MAPWFGNEGRKGGWPRVGSRMWALVRLALWTVRGTCVALWVLLQRLRAPLASAAKGPANRHSSTFPIPLSWDQNEDLSARAPARECAGHLRQGGSRGRGREGTCRAAPGTFHSAQATPGWPPSTPFSSHVVPAGLLTGKAGKRGKDACKGPGALCTRHCETPLQFD